jgi:hypothetical protein
MTTRTFLTIATLTFLLLLAPLRALAVDQASLDEFTVLMDTLIQHVEQIESGYNPALIGNIARTRRLEVFNSNLTEIEGFVAQASGRSDPNSARLVSLLETVDTTDPTTEDMKPLLLESWVRTIILECRTRGIGTDVVADYIKRSTASFVADRGNFFHPDFDESVLGSQDIVKIYFTGFGLVVLVQMDGGIDKAIELYDESTELRPYFAQQLVFRGADLDMDGIPLLRAVLFDPAIAPPAREVFYGVLAGKLMGPAGQFGNHLQLSDTWKETLADWAMQHITAQDRLDARLQLPFYGVEFNQADLGPESLLGLIGPTSESRIASLLSSGDPMKQVCGLEALRWFDLDTYPDEAATLFALAEPIMQSTDFTLAVLAMNAFEVDARYMGEPYDQPRRERLYASLPALINLMDRALRNENIDYLSTTAWLDIYAEGSLAEELRGLTPMVARVVASDWQRKQAGEEVYMPEGEVEVLTHFLPDNCELFDTTSPAVLGFLNDELSTNTVNPFRIWTYVNYLKAAVEAGGILGDDWKNAIARVKAWTETAPALINGDELKRALDELLQ